MMHPWGFLARLPCRTTAVYASDPALPRRPQDSLPSRLLSFGRTRLALASSYRLLLSHPASGFPTGFIAGIRRAGDTSVNPWSRFALAARYSFLGRVRTFSGVSRLIANHPDLAIVESAPEVRVLPSPGAVA